MRWLRRLSLLPAEQRRQLWPAFWRLLRVRVMLSLRGLAHTQRRLSPRAPSDASDQAQDLQLWHRRAQALERVARVVPDARCLARSVALWAWMRDSGIHAQLKLGVRRGSAGVESHAWVEYANQCFGETAENAASYVLMAWPDDQS